MITKTFIILVLGASTLWASAIQNAELYKARYGVTGPYKTIVDNKGNGYENLYGTRNVRAVLHGVLYRGGGNNSYHQKSPRNNVNPLQDSALENLCKEGFSGAIYAYKHNYETARREQTCDSFRQRNNRFTYHQYNSLNEKQLFPVLDLIHRVIINQQGDGPIYYHCWNGWHASGHLAAVALMQFCDYTGDQAASYWEKTSGGTLEKYTKVLNGIKSFQPYGSLRISPEQQRKICPSL